MVKKDTNIIQDISLLYELSLAVGSSLDVHENCTHFLKVLQSRKKLSFARIWLKNEKTNSYEVLFTQAMPRKKAPSIPKNHYILKRLKSNHAFSVAASDKKISQDLLDFGFSKGVYAFFKLNNLGFLELHSKLKEKRYSSFELNQLNQVIDKFSISLEACLAHKKLKETTASKEQTEKDLYDSENMFQSLFEQSPLGIIIGHEEGNLIANQRFADMIGCSIEEFSKLKLEDFSPLEEEVRFYKNLQKLKDGKIDHLHMVKKYLRTNGSSFWGNLSIAPLIGNDGKFKTHISFIEDYTEKRLTEESLKQSEKKLKDAQQIAKMGSYELDLETGEMNWSEETYRIFKRALDKPCPTFEEYLTTVHPDDIALVFDSVATIRENKETKGTLVLRSYTDEGKLIYTKGLAKAKIENGQVVKLFGTVQDITEQKLNEFEREKLLKEVEEVNKELENFAYIVSHDLKAPLRAITSLSQWIQEDYKEKLDETGQEYLQLLVGRVGRMHHFIEGILEYSRIGRQSLKKENIDFNVLVKSVIETLDSPAHIKIKIKNKLPTFSGERLRMEQLFQNLISNAIKYNDKKRGIIEISYTYSPTHHCFAIKDNGTGIEEKYFEKIFQIFQTLQPRDQFESTGIGLTIVKRIIELNEGNIRLESTLGKGTTIHFTLKQ